jgi:hypothetical protein
VTLAELTAIFNHPSVIFILDTASLMGFFIDMRGDAKVKETNQSLKVCSYVDITTDQGNYFEGASGNTGRRSGNTPVFFADFTPAFCGQNPDRRPF